MCYREKTRIMKEREVNRHCVFNCKERQAYTERGV